MLTRRKFLSSAAALGAMAPATAFAHASGAPFELAEEYKPQFVPIREELDPGQIIVLPRKHFLYFIEERGQALRYGVGVGRAGLEFTGSAKIQRKAKWPSWRPTDEMIAREPEKYARFADGVPGGINNPLGARALYLYQNGIDTYYRIHGTNQPNSIGRSVSNGCIRMLNEHVKELYERVPIGTTVTVV